MYKKENHPVSITGNIVDFDPDEHSCCETTNDCGVSNLSNYPSYCVNKDWHPHYEHRITAKVKTIKTFRIPENEHTLVPLLKSFSTFLQERYSAYGLSDAKKSLYCELKTELQTFVSSSTKDKQYKVSEILSKIFKKKQKWKDIYPLIDAGDNESIIRILRKIFAPRFLSSTTNTYSELRQVWFDAHKGFHLQQTHCFLIVTHNPELDSEASDQIRHYMDNEFNWSWTSQVYDPYMLDSLPYSPDEFFPCFYTESTKYEMIFPNTISPKNYTNQTHSKDSEMKYLNMKRKEEKLLQEKQKYNMSDYLDNPDDLLSKLGMK